MKKVTLGLAVLGAISVVGCNSDSGGNGVSLKTPTYEINEANRSTIDRVTYAYASDLDAEELFIDLSDFSTSNVRLAGKVPAETWKITPRLNESQTIQCDSGEFTVQFSGNGIDEETQNYLPSGSLSLTWDYDNCLDGSTREDGSMTISMAWSGYDSFDNSYDSLNVNFTFNDLTSVELSNGSVESQNLVHGSIESSLSGSESILTIGMSISSPIIENKVINIETTSPIKQRKSDNYPYSGVVKTTGGSDSQVVYTIVPNGADVSLNGGQAETVTWSELD